MTDNRSYHQKIGVYHRKTLQCIGHCALGILGITLLFNSSAFAASSDLLMGTDAALKATLQGTGKMYLYLAEGIVSLVMYIKTKNIMVLCGIIIVSIFFNIMLKLAGV